MNFKLRRQLQQLLEWVESTNFAELGDWVNETGDQFVEQIQELRTFPDNDVKTLKQVVSLAHQLALLILDGHPDSQKLIWVIRDLLGHDESCFSELPFSDAHIKQILKGIETNDYRHYPHVILARYVPAKHRKSLFQAVVDYADQDTDSMTWAMTGEACETLGFLNVNPAESMACLARHLNDSGFDGLPNLNIMKVMHVFRKHAHAHVSSISQYFLTLFEPHHKEVRCLSKLLVSPQLARELKPAFRQIIHEWGMTELIKDQEIGKYNRQEVDMLALYGQICWLAESSPG